MKLFRSNNSHQAGKRRRKIPYDVYEQHIGLVGLGGAGKTVFLTSLIDNIRLDGFRERCGVSLTNFMEREMDAGSNDYFPYRLYRERIAEDCTWPEKTGKALHYSCDFRRTDWSLPIRLHFYDIPGERIADAAVFDHGFRDWCRHTLAELSQKRTAEREVSEYTAFCQAPEHDAQAIVQRYKLVLGRLVNDYRALITPSTYLLGLDGKMLDVGTPESWADQRCVGIDRNNEFAPLSEEVLQQKPELFKQFEAGYKAYQKQVVKPIFTRLRKCHQLYILIDVPGLLSASVRKFNDADTLTEDLLTSCKPRNRFLRRVADLCLPHCLGLRGIKRVGLVGTKSDMIRRDQTDRLKSLLHELAGRKLNDLKTFGVHTSVLTCASVRCTEAGSDPEHLRGHPQHDENGVSLPPPRGEAKMQEYPVDSLPDTWPRNWQPDDFSFPDVYPMMPVNFGKAPDQEGLWDILSFICGGGIHDDA